MDSTPIEGFRLSPQQRHVWLLQQTQAQQPYVARCAITIDGPLDVPALKAALARVVGQHEILRTTFHSLPGMQLPLQVIAETTQVAIQEHDLRELDSAAQEARLAALWLRDQPFDLAHGPLLDVVLAALAPERHVLIIGLPSLCADQPSLAQLARAIAGAYAGSMPQLDDGLQYADIAQWQNELLESAETAEGRAYWQQQDFSALYGLKLPFERSAGESGFAPAYIDLALPSAVGAAIRAWAAQHDASSAVFVLACWVGVLARMSGQDELIVAASYDGRTYAEIEQAIGLFARQLPIACRLPERASFSAVVEQLRRAMQAGHEWQEYFAWEAISGVAGAGPLFCPIGFDFAASPAPYRAGAVVFTITRQNVCAERFALKLACFQTGDAFALTFGYDANRYATADIERLARAFRALVASALAQPDAAIERLTLLDEAERDQLLAAINDAPGARSDGYFHQIFAGQAERTPDRTALVFDETHDARRTTKEELSGFVLGPASFVVHLTYAELNQRANQLAQYLRRLGVGPDVRVALCVERSIDLIVGLLGVLKAGGAYLPLDPTLPPERLAFMIDDSQAAVLITRQGIDDLRLTIDDLGESGTPIVNRKSKIVHLDADWPLIAQAAPIAPTCALAPANLAYVIYTSGSTGRPKGVGVEHRQVAAYLHAISERLDLRGPASFALVSTVAADLGNTAIFPALAAGGSLHVVDAQRAGDADALAAYMHEHVIDCLKIVPSHLRALMDCAHPAWLLPRQRLILGGEAAPWDWVAQLATLAAGCRILNHYGPTETTVGVLTYPFAPSQPHQGSATLPLGRPLSGTQVYVLDRWMQPVPTWAAGELFIGGAQLARGYLGRPDLTAERFVPCADAGRRTTDAGPDSSFVVRPASGDRLYRTGDLARVLPDGVIAFLGRVDQQVKIRGFRVELGEVEALLAQHPRVRAAVVLAREDQPGALRLVAYVVTTRDARRAANDDDAELAPSSVRRPSSFVQDLRDFLQAHLPDAMVPSAFVLLDALPLTPNGKIDRRALPAPQALPEPAREVIAARTPIEEVLAEIWSQLLGTARVDVNDSFFRLGGHSLLATQLIARIRAVFQVELPLRGVFETPTLAGLAERIAAARMATPGSAAAAIPLAARGDALPLSLTQQGIWFIEQLAPSSTPYTMAMAVRARGVLNPRALQQSVDALVQRHEILRTSFPVRDGRAIQRVAASLHVPLRVLDLTALPQHTRAAAVERLAARNAGRSFELARGPLLRLTLLRLDAAEYVLLLAMHHIISDGWSLRVLTRELAAIYGGFCDGAPPTLPALPIQYADYAIWQRDWLQGAAREQLLGYWRQQLADAPALLELSTDRARPTYETHRGASHTFQMPLALSQALQALCRQEGVTLFMALLAAFDVILARSSGQDDIVVGTPIANRTRQETEGLIGLFLNTLVLRADLAGNPSFRELLGRVRELTLGAYAHQDLPFEQMVEELRPRRDTRHNPLFQVLFMFQNIPEPRFELPGLELSLLEVDSGTAMFDLTLALIDTDAGLYGLIEYSTDLFDATTIRRLIGHLQTLLVQVVTDAEQPIMALPLLTPPERQQLLIDWNATRAALPDGIGVDHLLAAQAARTPDAIALVYETNGERRTTNDEERGFVRRPSSVVLHLTYAELDRRANQLARQLRALGVGPEVRVGIRVARSPELVVALLGVLKAGGAYVPLDPTYPQERLAFMLADAQVAVLISATDDGRWTTDDGRMKDGRRTTDEEAHAESLPDLGLTITDVRAAETPIINRQAKIVHPDNLAYVIYTSGSTGTPKGVAITHGALVNFLATMRRQPGISAQDTLLAVTSVSFDIAGLELFLPLCVGARLVLADAAQAGDGTALRRQIARNAVTLMQATPATWRMLIDAGWPGDDRLTILCGGEALPRDLADALRDRSAALWNMYGPTETTIWSAAMQVTKQVGAVGIGRPIANTQIMLLDRQLRPVPIGVTGELFIGGAGLARGYLGRPDLTAERFVPNPFVTTNDERRTTNDKTNARPVVLGPSPCVRLYKTGDLARYRPDGNIQFLGRNDQQIKLRGFRIELGEIAAALARHPAVRESAVVARSERPGDARLVAYVITTNDERRTTNEDQHDPSFAQELRAFLRDRLPDYMIPSAFVLLDALPLTPNGKLDRRALPAPDQLDEQTTAFVAPRTPQEELLADMWAAVLGREQVGIHDHFFELGGHSLLVTQIVSRVRDAFAVELPLRTLFEAPTVAELAERITLAHQSAQSVPLPALRPAARDGELPLSFAQQRLWFLDQLMPNSPFYNIPAAVRVSGRFDASVLARALGALIDRHEALRTTFPAVDGRTTQRIAPAGTTVVLPIIDLQPVPAPVRECLFMRLAADEARAPFDLARGPLVRATLLRADAAEHVLLLTMHHIVSDGWSLGVFVQELGALYSAFDAGAAAPLPPLPIQYADYAIWQRAWLRGAVLEAQLAYWRDQLGGELPVLDLPLDRPRPPTQFYRGATQRFVLPAPLTGALKQLSRRAGVTLFMTLLAVFQTLLARYSGQADLAVGVPIANRTRAEIEHLIGFFVNTLVLRTNLAGEPSVRALLLRVREVCLGAYAHQDLPFEKLVDELKPDRDMSHNPLFQVMFGLQNMPLRDLELPSVTLRTIPAENGTAKFDLWLALSERGEQLAGTLEYSTDLFDASSIARMIGHFATLLAGAVADPDQAITALPLLTAAERQQVLVGWNDTAQADQRAAAHDHAARCLHELVEAQAARTPDVIALVFDETHDERRRTNAEGSDAAFVAGPASLVQLSYAELNRRANQLARWLQANGVGPDMPVGVCVARSPELVVGVLGVLKAGGAYVPLDPAYPPARLAFMLDDARATVLITTTDDGRRTTDDLGESDTPIVHRPSKIVHLDADWPAIASMRADNLATLTHPDNLAYVIYTSGSTGTPKGVAIAHRSPVALVRWAQAHYRPAQLAGVLAATSICFDLSVFELFVPLSSGGTVILAENALRLPDLRCAEQVTLINSVPSVVTQLLRQGDIPAATRTINLAGEPLPLHLMQQLYQQDTVAQVINLYGPSEATTYSSWTVLARTSSSAPAIGRPITGTQIYLLDARFQPVPIGVAGELFIGGAGLARGYLGRPALTAERFVPCADERRRTKDDGPDSSFVVRRSSGDRLYRTGDLARWLPDGNIQFLGRADQQVKLRGYRIELGEVEAVLTQHPAVWEAAADVWEDQPGVRRLVAYVVPTVRDAEALSAIPGMPAPAEQIGAWQQVFDTAYQQALASVDPTFNIAGWNSSFTGEPLPAAQMAEWVEQTCARIRALRPQRVLELGCGTGLLLFRIAPDCAAYVGTDFSQAAITQLRQHVERQALPQVALHQRAADDLSGFAEASFDLVIVNSVIQYFPSIEYLLRVLERAARLIAPGGRIFLGDMRSFALLAAFHTAVELYKAPATQTTEQLRRRVQRRLLQENELTVAPAFFAALARHIPQIGQVDIQLRRGRSHNELTQFRYDVVLQIGPAQPSGAVATRLNWQHEQLSVPVLRQLLIDAPDRLEIARVPNARLALEIQTLALLTGPEQPQTVRELRQALLTHAPAGAVDPEDLWGLADELPYAVAIRWSADGADGCYDAVFQRVPQPATNGTLAPAALGQAAAEAHEPIDWRAYANEPLRARLAQQLVPHLRTFLQARLPEYLVPGTFVLLDTLPLTPNGKLDRAALPAPLIEPDDAFVAPRTPVEQALAEIWAQTLGLPKVGVHANFFALGGDSILGMQIIARAQQVGWRITPKQLFQHQTVAELAAVVTAPAAAAPPAARLPLTRFQQALLEQRASETLLLTIPAGLDAPTLAAALVYLPQQHDALRLHLADDSRSWLLPPRAPKPPFQQIELTALSPAAQVRLLREVAAHAHPAAPTDPPLRMIRFDAGAQPGALLLIGQPLLLDQRAWPRLLADLWRAYIQLREGTPVTLPSAPSFAQWLGRPASQRAIPAASPTPAPSDERRLLVQLDAATTNALRHDVHQAYHTDMLDLLLTALAQAVASERGLGALRLDLEVDGRSIPPAEAQGDMVGCTTSVIALLLDLRAARADQPAAAIKSVKEQIRVALHADAAETPDTPPAELCFAYAGADDEIVPAGVPFALASAHGPADSDSLLRPPYRLAVRALVVAGQLRLVWSYAAQAYQQQQIQRLAGASLDALRALIAHCRAPEAGGFTPSDFPKAKLNQKDLDKLISRLGKTGERKET
jgi:amino acid adenylation domain-containing protein/non-ribosomal peptide synthase protein (TIGR01720 family)